MTLWNICADETKERTLALLEVSIIEEFVVVELQLREKCLSTFFADAGKLRNILPSCGNCRLVSKKQNKPTVLFRNNGIYTSKILHCKHSFTFTCHQNFMEALFGLS